MDSTSYWECKEAPFWRLGWIPKEEASVFREAESEAGHPGQQSVVRERLHYEVSVIRKNAVMGEVRPRRGPATEKPPAFPVSRLAGMCGFPGVCAQSV